MEPAHQPLRDAFDNNGPWFNAEWGTYFDLVGVGDPRQASAAFKRSVAEHGLDTDPLSEWNRVVDFYGAPPSAIQYETAELVGRCGIGQDDLPCMLIFPIGSLDPVTVRIPETLAYERATSARVARLVQSAFPRPFLQAMAAAPTTVTEQLRVAATDLQNRLLALAAQDRREAGTWVKAYGREIVLASGAKARLDPTDEEILVILLSATKRLLTTEIALQGAFKEKSIGKNLSRLKQAELVENPGRRGYALTPSGRSAASEIRARRQGRPSSQPEQ